MGKVQAGQGLDSIISSKLEAKIGDYIWSHLDVPTFNSEHFGTWLECNGQSCENTEFELRTGESIVPDVKTEGLFIRAAKADRTIGTYEADEILAHTHMCNDYYGADGVFGGTYKNSEASSGDGGTVYDVTRDTEPTGGDETRPKNIALNLYVKVDY